MEKSSRSLNHPKQALIHEFKSRLLHQVKPYYSDRNTRNMFAAKLISSDLVLPQGGKILNIGGGGKRHLAAHLNSLTTEVFEVDLAGDCDLIYNLDCGNPLPLESDSYDLCCAFDVLEHLENLHDCFKELVRISSNKVLISLPISSYEFFWNIVMHSNKKPYVSKFYSLYSTPPEDRHRWWLTALDTINFFLIQESRMNLSVRFAIPPLTPKSKLLSLFLGDYRRLNLLTPWIWILITKNPNK